MCLAPDGLYAASSGAAQGTAQGVGSWLAGREVHGPPFPSSRCEVSLETAPTMFFSHSLAQTRRDRGARRRMNEGLHTRVSLADDALR